MTHSSSRIFALNYVHEKKKIFGPSHKTQIIKWRKTSQWYMEEEEEVSIILVDCIISINYSNVTSIQYIIKGLTSFFKIIVFFSIKNPHWKALTLYQKRQTVKISVVSIFFSAGNKETRLSFEIFWFVLYFSCV